MLHVKLTARDRNRRYQHITGRNSQGSWAQKCRKCKWEVMRKRYTGQNWNVSLCVGVYICMYVCMYAWCVYACVCVYAGFYRHHLSTDMLLHCSSTCTNTLQNIANPGFTSSSGHRWGCLHGPCCRRCTRQ